MKWTTADIPDQTGKIAVITGANSGLGYETAKALVAKGAEVVMACRSLRKAEEAAAWLREEYPGAIIHVMGIDLAALRSVAEFAEAYKAKFDRLDLLINNAGLMALPLRHTEDGFEMQFGTNHLGHFALTMQLMPVILPTDGARVVQVTSAAHAIGRMDFNDLNWDKGYSKWRAYGRSKLANLLFSLELDRKFKERGKNAIANAAHPGYAATNLQARGKAHGQSGFETWFMDFANRTVAQSAAMGALPQLFAATSPDAQGGKLYGPSGWLSLSGHPQEEAIRAKFLVPELAKQLWEASEKLTGVGFDF